MDTAQPSHAPALYFVLGSSVLAGCFWTAPNWGYRWVFALWLLPYFWANELNGVKRCGLLGPLLRWAWWIPLWWEPIYYGLKQLFPLPDRAVWVAWWSAQAVAWLWFSILTMVVGGFLGRQLFDRKSASLA